jgi:hypothetical protein
MATVQDYIDDFGEEKVLQFIMTGEKTIEYRTKYSKSEKAQEYRKAYGRKQRDLFKVLKSKLESGEISIDEE